MGQAAAYDEIADWYEEVFLAAQRGTDPLGISRVLTELLGVGAGSCLEIGCGTGVHSRQVRALGWTPVGVDLSAGMLRHARDRLPVVQGNVERLPVRDRSVAAVVAVMVHTDIPDYPAALHEVSRVLVTGGVFVHVGVHPCFCGGFADRTDRDALVIRPGYLDTYWTKDSWTSNGIRDKVGAMHRPLPALLHAFLNAGLRLEGFAEGGAPTPTVLAVRARKLGS